MENELPAPNPPATNNEEAYLAMLAGVEGLPMPSTINNNVEYYLRYLVENGGGGGGGTTNYNQLSNKPQINSTTLSGNKSLDDLGIQAKIDAEHKLSADNVDDTSTNNKFVTSDEKTTLKTFNYSRNGTNNTWAKVATTSLVKTWEEKHAYLFVQGTHSTNFNQNGIISIDAIGNATKSKVKSYSAQFISASTDLDVENFYIEYQDGDENTDATINFWVRITTSTYATWQFKILQNIGWTIESANTSVTTLPTQDFTGKISELNNKTLNDKDGNDITTTYVKNTDYATSQKAGVLKTSNANAVGVSSVGTLFPSVLTYPQYTAGGDWMFIGKGTLENVITGKGLENKYSMSEIKTGTWIDNKPVYRRIFTIDLGTAPNIAQAHSLTDLDKFWINQSASFVLSSSESLPPNWYYSDVDWARTWMTNTAIRFRSPVDLTNRVLYVAVEYTKATD